MSDHPQSSVFLRSAYEGKLDIVLQMLEKDGVPVNATNQTGLQALHFAAKRNNLELADELLKHGATVNAATLKGNTPLHVAALMGHSNIIKLLLNAGAEVNSQSDCHGELFTPLYMSSQIGNQEIVTLLLAHGADPSITTHNGSTAHDVALQQGHHVVSELLAEYGSRLRKGTPLDDDKETAEPNTEEEQGAAGGSEEEGAAGGADSKKKVGPSPVCQDICASPRHSPKRVRQPLQINGQNASVESQH